MINNIEVKLENELYTTMVDIRDKLSPLNAETPVMSRGKYRSLMRLRALVTAMELVIMHDDLKII